VLAYSTTQGYRSEARHEIARLLLDSFAFMLLRRSSGTIMTAEYTSFGRLDTASLRVDQGKRCWRKQIMSRWGIHNQDYQRREEEWDQKVESPCKEVSLPYCR